MQISHAVVDVLRLIGVLCGVLGTMFFRYALFPKRTQMGVGLVFIIVLWAALGVLLPADNLTSVPDSGTPPIFISATEVRLFNGAVLAFIMGAAMWVEYRVSPDAMMMTRQLKRIKVKYYDYGALGFFLAVYLCGYVLITLASQIPSLNSDTDSGLSCVLGCGMLVLLFGGSFVFAGVLETASTFAAKMAHNSARTARILGWTFYFACSNHDDIAASARPSSCAFRLVTIW